MKKFNSVQTRRPGQSPDGRPFLPALRDPLPLFFFFARFTSGASGLLYIASVQRGSRALAIAVSVSRMLP